MGVSEFTVRISWASAKPSFFRHHHIKHTNIVILPLRKALYPLSPSANRSALKPFCLEIFAKQHAQILIVFA